MGFMDKLKDVGKKALFGVMIAGAKKYGTVVEGKYKGCQVTADRSGDNLMFVMVAKENGRHHVKEDIQSMVLIDVDSGHELFHLTLNFKDGEKSVIAMKPDKNQGSALPTAEERLAAYYAHIAEFLIKLVDKVEFSEATKSNINLIMRFTRNKEI